MEREKHEVYKIDDHLLPDFDSKPLYANTGNFK